MEVCDEILTVWAHVRHLHPHDDRLYYHTDGDTERSGSDHKLEERWGNNP